MNEFLDHSISDSLLKNWVGFDRRIGLPGGAGGEISFTINPAEYAASGSFAVSGSIFG